MDLIDREILYVTNLSANDSLISASSGVRSKSRFVDLNILVSREVSLLY